MAKSRRSVTKVTASAPVAYAPPPPPPPPVSQFTHEEPEVETGLNKAKIIRDYLQEVGVHNANIADLRNWIHKRFPGASFGDAGMRTTLSQQRKRLLGNESAIMRPSKPMGVIRAATRFSPDSLSYGNLAAVKEKAEQFEGGFDLDALADQVEKVAELASAVGGIENLLKAIQALRDLRS